MENFGTCVLKRYLELKSQTSRPQPVGSEKGRTGAISLPQTLARELGVVKGNLGKYQ